MTHFCSERDHAFVEAFEAGDITPDNFSHREHLRLAYVYLVGSDVDTACNRMRTALHLFLDRYRLDPTKYNETMTRAWTLAVQHFIENTPASASASEFIDANPALLDPDIMLTHYSAETLFSDNARTAFIEPDREPIPRHEPD